MEQVPKMIAPTPTRRRLHPDRRADLEQWHSTGRPPKGYFSYKLDFGAEVLRESPPTIIGSASTHTDRSEFRRTVESESPREATALHRRAFQLTAVDSPTFQPVLWSENGAVWVANGNLGDSHDGHAWRHGDCHELLFVHRAESNFAIATDFGVIEDVGTGDFVYLPRGTTYAFPDTDHVSALLYEVPEPIYRPYDYWMGDQQPWPYPPEAPRGPEPAGADPMFGDDPIRDVVVKRRLGDYTELEYETPVFDSVAWEGETWPFALNLDQLNTLTSPNFHLDPPKVTVFVSETEGMYLQAFLPRWMQSPPYNHMNSVDEALFNHRGYEARPEIGDGYLTLHPAGVPHGPDPRVVEELANEEPPTGDDIPWADEIGVMVETATPLSVLQAGESVEHEGYNESWSDIAEEEDLV